MAPIELYFRAEKAESLVFILAGVAAVGGAVWLLLTQRSALTTGLAIPLIVVGLIQLVVGGTVYLRSDAQQAELVALHAQSPNQFVALEAPRMQQVNRNFDMYKLVEIAFIVVGTGLIFFRQHHDFWLGLGLGMLLQGTVMLTADIFAERRADAYTAFVAQQG